MAQHAVALLLACSNRIALADRGMRRGDWGLDRGRYRVACLSNSNELHWKTFGPWLAPHLDARFVSFELGLAKPDPAIFRAALSALGAEPGEVLFFDDAEPNVAAAAGVGLDAELVRGASQLRERLARLGLLRA